MHCSILCSAYITTQAMRYCSTLYYCSGPLNHSLLFILTYKNTHIHVQTHVHTHVYTHMYTHMYICTHTCTRTHMHTYKYTHMYMYTHIHTFIVSHTSIIPYIGFYFKHCIYGFAQPFKSQKPILWL